MNETAQQYIPRITAHVEGINHLQQIERIVPGKR